MGLRESQKPVTEQEHNRGQQVQKPNEVDPLTKKALDEFAEMERDQLDRLRKILDEHVSRSQLGEVAIVETRNFIEAEIAKERDRLKDFSLQSRQAIADEIEKLQTTARYQPEERKNESVRVILEKRQLALKKKVDAHIQNIEAIVSIRLRDHQFMNERDLLRLKQDMIGVENLAMKDTKVAEILQKLKDRKALSDRDYVAVVKMLGNFKVQKPFGALPAEDNQKERDRQNFDTAAAAELVALMQPYQRKELVEFFINSDKKAESGKLIDAFLASGTLTIAQGQDLLEKARPVIAEDEYLQYAQKLQSGEYQKQMEKLTQEMENGVKQLQTMYAVNPIERGFGGPLLGAALNLHSILWFTANVLVAHGDLAEIIRNPFIYLGIGEYVLSKELSSGGIKYAAGWHETGLGAGDVAGAWDRLREEDRPKNEDESAALLKLMNIVSNHTEFRNYLEEGGSVTVMKLAHEKKAKHPELEKIDLTYDEVLAKESESNKHRTDLLTAAMKNISKEKLGMMLNETVAAADTLGVYSESSRLTMKNFNHLLDKVNVVQGLSRASAQTPKTKSPQMKT